MKVETIPVLWIRVRYNADPDFEDKKVIPGTGTLYRNIVNFSSRNVPYGTVSIFLVDFPRID